MVIETIFKILVCF